MQEIARFLAGHPPFDGLRPEALEQTAATVEIAYFPRGSSILRQGREPSRYLHVIVKGVVELRQADDRGASELVETLAEGETFGQLSLLSGAPHLWDAVAREDVLAYLIPASQVERLQQQPGFDALLARRAGDRLRHAIAASTAGAPLDPLWIEAGELARRPLVTCAPEDTVAQAARQMRDQQVSSLVVRGQPPGLVTATDLRDRVLAAGLDPDTPVRQVMTTPLHTMPAEASLGELLLAMVDRGVHHLPLIRQGGLVGMVTDTDLLREESRHPPGRVGGHDVARAAGEPAALQGGCQPLGQGLEPGVGARRRVVGQHQGVVLVAAQRGFPAGAAAEDQQRVRARGRPERRLAVPGGADIEGIVGAR